MNVTHAGGMYLKCVLFTVLCLAPMTGREAMRRYRPFRVGMMKQSDLVHRGRSHPLFLWGLWHVWGTEVKRWWAWLWSLPDGASGSKSTFHFTLNLIITQREHLSPLSRILLYMCLQGQWHHWELWLVPKSLRVVHGNVWRVFHLRSQAVESCH